MEDKREIIKFKQIGINAVHIFFTDKKEIFVLEQEEFFNILKSNTKTRETFQ